MIERGICDSYIINSIYAEGIKSFGIFFATIRVKPKNYCYEKTIILTCRNCNNWAKLP